MASPAPQRRLTRSIFSLSSSFHGLPHRTCHRAATPPHGMDHRPALIWQARCLSCSAPLWSGHSKWASIKHDKAKNDAGKSRQRAVLTKDICNAVKLAGPDSNMNPRLALAISTAKKNQVPKSSIEAAIARGQGLSATGAALESVTLEAILPSSVATVIECQTDNKLRALAELRLLIKEAGGTVSPIGYLFEKKGRIIFQKKEGIGADEMLEPALEAGALDVVEDDQGRVILFTEPARTMTTAESLAKTLDMEIEESDIIWDPNEDTKVALDDEEAAQKFNGFLDELQEVTGIQGIYTNWSKGTVSDDVWADLQSKVAV